MNINATVIIQAINFFIVYVMLRFFLFKPAVSILDRECLEEETLLGMVNQQKKSIEIQEKERQRYWYVCREYFKTHHPSRTMYDMVDFHDPIRFDNSTIVPMAHDAVIELAAHIYKNLEEKIKNVH